MSTHRFPTVEIPEAPNCNLSPDLTVLCFSHLRWDFVFQRPQHLMVNFSSSSDILFWEEPILSVGAALPKLMTRKVAPRITVITPNLPAGLNADEERSALKTLLETCLSEVEGPIIRWYYTPMMLPFSHDVGAVCTIYDCMDELANFKFASREIAALEQQLFKVANLVFTGGYSLYEAKRAQHGAIYPFPSSVDQAHFARALELQPEPADQVDFRRPRLGFFGVIDERMDLRLLEDVARLRPAWTFVIVGPVVKIDPDTLPQLPNIHYLGPKTYSELPRYAAGWDVALMPFAMNESTRFISPTKTPEYLAAGLPVVSTPIVDVVRHYAHLEAVHIASGADEFVDACEQCLALKSDKSEQWRHEVDAVLANLSWDRVGSQMLAHVNEVIENRQARLTKPHYDYLVVGAGFAGSVIAERLASDAGKRVLVIDRRPHVGGNAYDHLDSSGILIHQYGPHIFHTNSQEIVDYLSAFTGWRPYEHRVLAEVDNELLPVPINRTTINRLFNLSLSTNSEVEEFLAARAESIETIRTSADIVLSKVGRELYELFFQGYTRKQWGMDPSELDKTVAGRIPTRTNDDDRYFGDSFQAMPDRGFTALFSRMLDHPNIEIEVGAEFDAIRERVTFDRLVFTGPIDEYFGYCYGKLPYRSLTFSHKTMDQEWYQPVGVVNFPSEAVPYTRITEYKHLTGQVADKTSISYEYPHDDGEPYYPVPRPENQMLFKRYEALALVTPNVLFVGRLATYRYYNMDQVIGQALALYRRHKIDLSNEQLFQDNENGNLVAAE